MRNNNNKEKEKISRGKLKRTLRKQNTYKLSCDMQELRWQLEHSNALTSDTLQHPKFKYMPQLPGDCIPLFQKLLA